MKKQRFTKDLDRLDAEGNGRGNEGRGAAPLACDQLGDLRQPGEEHGGMEGVGSWKDIYVFNPIHNQFSLIEYMPVNACRNRQQA